MNASPGWYTIGNAGIAIGARIDGKRADIALCKNSTDATRIVIAVNAHGDLLAACQALADAEHMDNKTVDRAVKLAIAALAKVPA